MSSEVATTETGEVAKVPKTVIAMDKSGLQLVTFDDMWRFAKVVEVSGMVDAKRKAPSIVVSLQMGLELGFSPMQSIINIPVWKGRPCIVASAQRAVVNARARFMPGGDLNVGVSGEGDERMGWCESWQKGWTEPRRTTFTWKQAVTAGLTKPRGERKQPSVYMLYGEDMLIAKASARHCTRFYSKYTHGLVTANEAEEVYAREKDITPTYVGAALPENAQGPAHVDPLLQLEAPVDAEEPAGSEASTDDPGEPETIAQIMADHASKEVRSHGEVEGLTAWVDEEPGDTEPDPDRLNPEIVADLADLFEEKEPEPKPKPRRKPRQQDMKVDLCGAESGGEENHYCMYAAGHEPPCQWEAEEDPADPGPVPDESPV